MADIIPTPPATPLRDSTLPLDYGHAGRTGHFPRARSTCSNSRLGCPIDRLIWIYAERQQTETTVLPIPIDISINAPDRIVMVKDPPDRTVVVTLNGPRNGIQRVDDAIKAHERVQITLDGRLASANNRSQIRRA